MMDVRLYLCGNARWRGRMWDKDKQRAAIYRKTTFSDRSPAEVSLRIIEAARLAGSTRHAEPLSEDDVLPGSW
jgi:hypothetical protein